LTLIANRSKANLMATIILDISDDALLTQIKKICSMIKGVSRVKVIKKTDVTKTSGYREAMLDIKEGRVYHAKNTEDMFKQILG
jgi:hypothetical protein